MYIYERRLSDLVAACFALPWIILSQRTQLVELAAKSRLPAIYGIPVGK
jgi:hypothetical protein